jgi:spore coat protein U-like protein
VRYWCSKGAPYTVTIGNGNNYSAGRRMKGQSSTNSAEFLAYEVLADTALTGTGIGPNTPVDFRMTGKVKGPDYNSVSVGGFIDTLVVTIVATP